ncbi:MAG: general secretion pathway protein J [Syntrophorhabdus sp. PtaU1.Bin058]|nr:MAG: general secretion pathway protein J [Syntrophorhabdus sp. PtaU1.Bin058]
MISLIVAITGGAMSLASRSVDSGEKHIESLERFRASLNIVDSQIQSFLPVALQGSDPVTDKGYIFKGDSTSLLFSAGRSLWNSKGGYVVVQYKIESDGDGKQFLRIAEKMIGMKNENTTRLFVLYDRIYFEYFLKEPAEEKGTWVEQWTDNKVIPAMIRLNLIAGARRLSVIIPVRVGQAVNKRLSL